MSLMQRRGILDSFEGLVQYVREIANVEDSQIRQIVENAKAELAKDQAKRGQDLTSKFSMTEEDQAELWELERELHSMESKRTQAAMLPYVLKNARNFISDQKAALEKKQEGLRQHYTPQKAATRMLEFIIGADDQTAFDERCVKVLEAESADVHMMYEILKRVRYNFESFRDSTIGDLVSGIRLMNEDPKLAAQKLVSYADRLGKLQKAYCSVLISDAVKKLADLDEKIKTADEKATEVWDAIVKELSPKQQERNAHVQNAKSPLEQMSPEDRVALYNKAVSDSSFRHAYDSYKRAALNTKEDKIDGLREAEFVQLFVNYMNGDAKIIPGIGNPVEQLKKTNAWAYLLFNVDNKPKLKADNGPLSIEDLFLIEKGNPAPVEQKPESPGTPAYQPRQSIIKKLFGYFFK